MSQLDFPDPSVGGGVPPKNPGRVAGFFAALALDFLVWLVFLIIAMSRDLSRLTPVAVGMTFGYVIVGVALFCYARKRGYTEFKQGAILATSIVLLLSVACWGTTIL
jgi:hypothetical protein